MGDEKPFEYEHARFAEGARAQGVDVQQREAQYGEIFAEIIWDGTITANDRFRLGNAAEMLGLSQERTQGIERALRAAYEARHRVRVVEPDADESPTVDRLGFERDGRPLVDDPSSAEAVRNQRVSVTELDLKLRPSTDGPTPDAGVVGGAAEVPVTIASDFTDTEASARDPRDTIAPLTRGQNPILEALEGRIRFLETRNVELEREVERARTELAEHLAARSVSRDPAVLHARFCADPTDPAPLHQMFRSLRRSADLDRRWRVAHALAFLDAADGDERTFLAATPVRSPIKPPRPLSTDDWRNYARHPDEDELPGDIFAVIAPAVLLSQIAAIRGVAKLPTPPTTGRVDPQTTKSPAVRCVVWASAIMGISTPPIYVEPRHASLVEIIPGAPSSTRLGERAVTQRTPQELAFAIGRHLSSHRPEHFMASLVSSPRELDDLFLAALILGNPGLPMDPAKKARVEPVARSIDPLLSDDDRARLRSHFLRFVELGGKTNLRQWAAGRDLTAATAGLLLANDLRAARAMLVDELPDRADERMRALLGIWTGTRFGDLRRAIGVSVVGEPDGRDSPVPS